MANPDTKDAWERFQADVRNLAGDLRRHYRDAGDAKKTAEINRSLQQLGQAAETLFESVDKAARDPEVHTSSKKAARSFGAALAQTFRDVGDELDKALKEGSPPK
jgi:undecaprenyl pyrophosphate synthase